MSYFDDFEEDKLGSIEWDYDFIPEPSLKKRYTFQKCKDKWIDINGNEIKLKDMSTNHLNNCRHMIDRICHRDGLDSSDYKIYNLILKEIVHRGWV